MKLVIVGGSGQSTPSLFLHPQLQVSPPFFSVVLVGRSLSKLAAVQHAIRTVTRGIVEPNIRHFECQDDLDKAIEGADIVLVQARYGGYEGRAFDETFPHKYGICGDEGLGPGGLAAAWRAWPYFEELLFSVRASAPKALVLLMSSPLGVLLRAALMRFGDLRLAGICELPWTTLTTICTALHVIPSDIDFEYSGVNHLGWLHHLYHNNRDLVTEFASLSSNDCNFPPSALINACGGIPLKYLRLHYFSKQVLLEQQKLVVPRGEQLNQLQVSTIRLFNKGRYDEILDCLDRRPSPWYTHAIAPFIAKHMGYESEKQVIFFLTCLNNGYQPHLDNYDVIEIPHSFLNGKLKRLPTRFAPSTHITTTLQHFVRYERYAAEAVLSRDYPELEAAVRLHPWVSNRWIARRLACEIASAKGDALPQNNIGEGL